MQQTVRKSQINKVYREQSQENYNAPWNKLGALADKISKLWKTRKTAAQILRTERDY